MIFLLMAVLFLVVAPATVMYCLGWRLDLKAKKIIQPGMVYLKAAPKTAEVYIDGIFQRKTDFFFGSLLMENLLPKNYHIEIKKEGFHVWEKTLPVEKRKVTEAKSIILIPENPSVSLISKNVGRIYPSPNGRFLVIEEILPAEESQTARWSLKLINADNNSKSHLVSEESFVPSALKSKKNPPALELSDFTISEDSNFALVALSSAEKNYYYLLNLKQKDIEEIVFPEKNQPKEIVLGAERKIWTVFEEKTGPVLKMFDLEKKVYSDPLISGFAGFKFKDGYVYWLDLQGNLFKSGLETGSKEKINIMPIALKKDSVYKIEFLGHYTFLREDASLYMLENMAFAPLTDSCSDFKLSPDGKKLLYSDGQQAWVIFLEKKHEQPVKEAGEKIMVADTKNLGNVFWYTDNYLVYSEENSIKVTETDDRDKFNVSELFGAEKPEIYWIRNKLYFLSKDILSVSENLISS